MKDKTKRTLLIASGVVVCVALTVVIASLFNRPAAVDPAPESSQSSEAQPQVEIKTPDISTSNTGDTGATADPGTGADSSGIEQTIQADPVKPDAPAAPSTVAENHTAEDVPEADRNAETPPTYTKEQTTVTEPTDPQGGEGYLPGFGYIESSGEGTATVNEDMYENGNKVGIMD